MQRDIEAVSRQGGKAVRQRLGWRWGGDRDVMVIGEGGGAGDCINEARDGGCSGSKDAGDVKGGGVAGCSRERC